MNEGAVRGGVRRVVINACFGGFSLSAAATRRLAELNGRPCYFFRSEYDHSRTPSKHKWTPVAESEADDTFMWMAFDTPEVSEDDAWFSAHYLAYNDTDRDDPKLIQVIEELGAGHHTGASGSCAHLKIIEIPADVEWCISEYDGNESVEEKHRSWG